MICPPLPVHWPIIFSVGGITEARAIKRPDEKRNWTATGGAVAAKQSKKTTRRSGIVLRCSTVQKKFVDLIICCFFIALLVEHDTDNGKIIGLKT